MYAPLSFFNKTPTGVVLNRVGNDITKIDDSVPEAIRSVVEILILLVVNMCVLVYSIHWFALLFVPLFILYYFIQRLFVPAYRQIQRIESKVIAPMISHFQESVQGELQKWIKINS